MAQQKVSLRGQVAVITGSTRGIGRAIAEAYGHAGAQVVISSSRAPAVEQAIAALRAAGIDCIGAACNVADRRQVAGLLQTALEAFGKVDIWVNNAGISGPFGPTLDISPEDWEQVIQVNLLGCYHGSTVVLPQMIRQRCGKLINLSGGGANRPQRYLSAYSTSKAAIVALTRGLARDYAEHRFLAINVLTPGIVPTDMINQFETIGKGTEAIKQLPRIMRIFGTTAQETAELALHMASSATNGVSGRVYEVMPRRRSLWRLAMTALGRR
ncbi:MAG: SDR family oxidoreductase [Oscillochloris sp.]|nr:SDR family oxidoreductase [Oscillochloris sp.]